MRFSPQHSTTLNSSSLKRIFQKLRDGLVRKVGLTLEIKLRVDSSSYIRTRTILSGTQGHNLLPEFSIVLPKNILTPLIKGINVSWSAEVTSQGRTYANWSSWSVIPCAIWKTCPLVTWYIIWQVINVVSAWAVKRAACTKWLGAVVTCFREVRTDRRFRKRWACYLWDGKQQIVFCNQQDLI